MQAIFNELLVMNSVTSLLWDATGIRFTYEDTDYRVQESKGVLYCFMGPHFLCSTNDPQCILNSVFLPF